MFSQPMMFLSTLVLALMVCDVWASAIPPSPTVVSNGKWKCDGQSKKEVDEIVARIMTYGRMDRAFPVGKAQLRPYCKEQTQLVRRLEDYKQQCLNGDKSQHTVAIIIYSMKNLVNLYCKNPNSRRAQDLLDSAACANAASAEYNRCNIDYIDLLLAVENAKDSKQHLTQVCCGYAEVFRCIRERAAKFDECSEDHIEANVNYVRGFFDNAANLICAEYQMDTSDKCDKVKLYRKKNKQPSKRPQSYFNPLVHLLSTL